MYCRVFITMPSAKLKCKPGGNMISIIYHGRERELQLQLGTRDPVDNLHPEQLVEKKGKQQQRREKQMRNFSSVWIKFCGLKFSQEDFFWLRIAHMFNQQSQREIETQRQSADQRHGQSQSHRPSNSPRESQSPIKVVLLFSFFFYSQARSSMCDVRRRMYDVGCIYMARLYI